MRVNLQARESSYPSSFKFLFFWSNLVGLGWWASHSRAQFLHPANWPPGSEVVAPLFATAWLAVFAKPQRPVGFLFAEMHVAAALVFAAVVIAHTFPWLQNLSQRENFGPLFAIAFWIVGVPPAIAAVCYAFALHRISKKYG